MNVETVAPRGSGVSELNLYHKIEPSLQILFEFEASCDNFDQQVLVTRLGHILWTIEEATDCTLSMGKLLTILSFFQAEQHFMPL